MSNDQLLDEITSSFISSAEHNGFNGVVASTLAQMVEKPEQLRKTIRELITDGKITAVFARTSINMHIKRLPDLPISEQIELLGIEELNAFSLYPSKEEVERRMDVSAWQDRPFSKTLLLAEPQLAFRAFEMGALERYVADPRYTFKFNDYMGWMSIDDGSYRDEEHPERDKVYLQSFGLGFDRERIPYIVVYLRYLADLSAEHQQYWNSYQASGDIRMSKPYYLSSIRGEFWNNRSIRNVINKEMNLICQLSEAIWGQALFRVLGESETPIGLTSFLRPTSENFNRFVMELDKFLSERIDQSFFKDRCPIEIEHTRPDGKIEIKRKGTLSLLEDWLLKEIIWEDIEAFKKTIIEPLRRVRRLRQKPAHSFTTNDYSTEYYKKRKQLLWDVFNSLSNIRATFARHPLAQEVEIPDWLDNDQIDVF